MNTTNFTNEMVNLDDALFNQNTVGRPVKTFVGFNTGNRTFTLPLTLFEIQEYTEVANEQSKNSSFVAQRKLDMDHATGIAKYILKGLLSAAERKNLKHNIPTSNSFEEVKKQLGSQPYIAIPPLVASFRNCSPNGTTIKVIPLITSADGETACYKIFINPGDTFWIVDGQHRRKGLHLVYEFLNYVSTYQKYPGRASLYKTNNKEQLTQEELKVWADCTEMMRVCTVSLEVHLGLDIDQERQLFHDLNNLGKRVDKNLALNFDGSNPVNLFTGEVVIEDVFANVNFPPSTAKDSNDWKIDGFTRQELVSINALLFLNKTNVNGAVPAFVEPKKTIAKLFWDKVVQIPGLIAPGSKQVTVAAQRVVLKALAKLVYDFAFGKWTNKEQLLHLLESIPTLDFTHNNPVWRYYDMDEIERQKNNLETLEEYLPSENEGVNRGLGNYDQNANVFRFDVKHNDIYPILGDMIRWQLDLPPRKKAPSQLSVDFE